MNLLSIGAAASSLPNPETPLRYLPLDFSGYSITNPPYIGIYNN